MCITWVLLMFTSAKSTSATSSVTSWGAKRGEGNPRWIGRCESPGSLHWRWGSVASRWFRSFLEPQNCRLERWNPRSGWWFGTFFIFPYIGNNHPNWLIFFRGVETTNQIYGKEMIEMGATLGMSSSWAADLKCPTSCTPAQRFWFKFVPGVLNT